MWAFHPQHSLQLNTLLQAAHKHGLQEAVSNAAHTCSQQAKYAQQQQQAANMRPAYLMQQGWLQTHSALCCASTNATSSAPA
jgi:hypothetical protein